MFDTRKTPYIGLISFWALLISSIVTAQEMPSLSTELVTAFAKTASQVGLDTSAEQSKLKATPYELWGTNGPLFQLTKVTDGQLTVGFDKRDLSIRTLVLPYGFRGRSHDLAEQLRAASPEAPLSEEEEVTEKCIDFLSSLGLRPTSDLRVTNAKYYGSGASGKWSISWTRYIGAFPTEERWFLSVSDQTCSINEFVNLVSSATCATEIRISKEDAREKARVHAEIVKNLQCTHAGADPNAYALRETTDSWSGGKLEIIHPNYVYLKEFHKARPDYLYGIRNDGSGKLMTEEEVGQARDGLRLVYMIGFKLDPVDPARGNIAFFSVVVWIDARSGEVVGGL